MYHFAPSGEGRCILSRDVICEFANNALPPEISLNTWSREYSLSRDGSDFHTFLNKVRRERGEKVEYVLSSLTPVPSRLRASPRGTADEAPEHQA